MRTLCLLEAAIIVLGPIAGAVGICQISAWLIPAGVVAGYYVTNEAVGVLNVILMSFFSGDAEDFCRRMNKAHEELFQNSNKEESPEGLKGKDDLR